MIQMSKQDNSKGVEQGVQINTIYQTEFLSLTIQKYLNIKSKYSN